MVRRLCSLNTKLRLQRLLASITEQLEVMRDPGLLHMVI